MAFEVATFTDVVAAEAIDGVDGFNFQSVSEGVTGVDQQRIREALLHRVEPAWALEHDPLSHPSTCAYVVQDGRSYLSRGKSTGDTNNGRPGNQITQAIVTSDPDDFVPYRPAQLYGATGWTLRKAAGQTSERWVTPLEIAPEFETAALEAMVAQDEWARAVLPHFLTMVDAAVAPEPKKLVLVHDDLDVVMQWIALGTHFVEADAARVLQFRALVDDPLRADAVIVGVSPHFARVDMSAANVLDLSARSAPAIEPSASARTRASWFVEQGADDALNAIEIARRWESSLGVERADDAARVVGLPDAVVPGGTAWRASMTATEQLADAGLRDDLALYAEELCDAAVGHGPTTAAELALAGRAIRKAHDLGVDELAAGLLVPTLEALAAVPAQVEPFAGELSGASAPVQWDSVESRDAASAFMGQLLVSAPVDALPELFTAARVVAVPVPEPDLHAAVQRLADAWVAQPSLGSTTWCRWLAGRAVLEAVAGSLVASLASGDEATSTALTRGDWDFLKAHTDDDGVHGWLKAAELARIPVDRRHEHVGLVGAVPGDAWRVVLTGSSVPRHAQLWSTWITHHGLATAMARTLTRTFLEVLDSSPPADGSLPAGGWHRLVGSLMGSADPELAGLAAEYLRVQGALRRAREESAKGLQTAWDPFVAEAGRLAPLLLPDVGLLLLDAAGHPSGGDLERAVGPWVPTAIHAALRVMATDQAICAIDLALMLRDDTDEPIADAAGRALAEIFESKPDLLEVARDHPQLKGGMDRYLRQKSRAQGGRRRLAGPFGRNKEK